MTTNPRLDIPQIAARALEQAPHVLGHWLPEGKRQGVEWLARNPTRADDRPGSFSVNTATGQWSDFATGDKGGDLVGLVAYLEGARQLDAARALADFMGITDQDTTARRAPGPAAASLAPPAPALDPIPAAALAGRPTAHPRHRVPSASWVYRDAEGRELFHQHRFDPPQGRKVFAPQTWNATTGWAWKAPPAPRPLYGLDLLAARPDAPVLVTEGEKAADAARTLVPESVVITAVNGAQSPALTDWTPVAGRTVRVWPDADAPGATFAKHVADLARAAGAASVAILDLNSIALDPGTGEQRPHPPGWDAADALADGWQAATLARSARWLDQDTAPTWPTPQPVSAHLEATSYPADALPTVLKAAIDEVQGFTQAPYALVANSAIAALALVTQALADVRRAAQLTGPTSLFMLTVAESGERKSATDDRFLAPVRQWEQEQRDAHIPLAKEYRANLEAWDAEKAGLKDKIRQEAKSGKPTAEFKRQLRALEQEEPIRPREPRLLFTDATPEALAYGLAKGWPSGGVFSAEAGLVLGASGMGKDSILRNLALFNQLWDGASFRIDRKTSESFQVSGVRASAHLLIQQAALLDFIDRAGTLARGSGWFARFLIAHPESTQGTRSFREPPANWPAHSRYCASVLELLKAELPTKDDGTLAPPLLDLAPQAKAAWIQFHDAIERELADGGELRQVRDVAAKCADNAARLAAIFHVFVDGPTGAIGLAAFESAARVVAWHLHESRRFFGELALPQELADAARLDAWLIATAQRERTALVPKNQARQFGPLRDGARLDKAIQELDALDRLRVNKEGRRLLLALNPAILAEEDANG